MVARNPARALGDIMRPKTKGFSSASEGSKDLVAFTNLAAAHDAAIGWFSYPISTQLVVRNTLQLRRDLIRADGRPVLLQCHFTDVDQDQNGYMLEGKMRGLRSSPKPPVKRF